MYSLRVYVLNAVMIAKKIKIRGKKQMNLKGTKTAVNLMKSFAGESQARNRYTFYASVADKEGYKQIKNIFLETADNEKEHAKRFYKFLLAGLKDELPATIEIESSFPVAQDNALENLKSAANVENEEGFQEIADVFRAVALAEKAHENRFNKLAQNVENGEVFKKEKKILWKCGNCGYIYEGTSAPTTCPACAHPTAHFEVFVETY